MNSKFFQTNRFTDTSTYKVTLKQYDGIIHLPSLWYNNPTSTTEK